jgi:hypothetical protein
LDDGVDRYLSIIGATSASSLERSVAMRDTLALFSANRYERPIARSRGAVHPRVMECCQEKDRHGERTQPRRQCGARIDVDGTPFSAWEHRNFAKSPTTVATASLIENWIDG